MKRTEAERSRDAAESVGAQTSGVHDLAGRRFGIVAALFNRHVVDKLLDGAADFLRRHGAGDEDVTVLRVPGAWEIPLALDELAAGGSYDALVGLGVVIRGETPHFDYVCSEASRGFMDVSLRRRIAVGFGLLTTDDEAQALARAGGSAGNKGEEAASAAVDMLFFQQQVRGSADRLSADQPGGAGS